MTSEVNPKIPILNFKKLEAFKKKQREYEKKMKKIKKDQQKAAKGST